MKTQIYIDAINGATGAAPETVTLAVLYAGKISRIELVVPEPLFDREPSADAYRRALQELLTAIEGWEGSHEGITRPPHSQT